MEYIYKNIFFNSQGVFNDGRYVIYHAYMLTLVDKMTNT